MRLQHIKNKSIIFVSKPDELKTIYVGICMDTSNKHEYGKKFIIRKRSTSYEKV